MDFDFYDEGDTGTDKVQNVFDGIVSSDTDLDEEDHKLYDDTSDVDIDIDRYKWRYEDILINNLKKFNFSFFR